MSTGTAPTNRRDLSVSMAEANLYALVATLPPAALIIAGYSMFWGIGALGRGAMALFGNFLLFVAILVVGVVVHELIHGLTWALAGRKPLRAIRFGVQWKTLTPYAHCSEPLEVRAYRIGAAMPGLLLGILPSLAGIVGGSGFLTAFGLFFTLAAGGDFLILWLIRGVRPGTLVEDHPERAGCYVID